MTITLATPTAVLAAPPTQTHDEFVRIRKELFADRISVGSSDIAAICGMDRWRSPFAVYLEMTGELPDIPRTAELEDAAELGLIYEDGIARLLARRHGFGLLPTPGTLAHVDRPWQLANVDRLVDENNDGVPDAPVECKNRSVYQLGDWEDGVPDAPALQAHWQLGVTGYDHVWVAAVLGGNTPRFYRLERDQSLIDHLVQIADDFRQRVIDRRPPDVDGSEATTDLLAHLYDVQPEAVTALPDDAAKWLAERRRAKGLIKDLEVAVAEAENHLKVLLGEHEIGLLDDKPAATWKANGTFREKAFREEHPDVYADCSPVAPSFDLDLLKERHPDLYAAYRSRKFLTTGAWK
jgi:putative phage-type endonuclease